MASATDDQRLPASLAGQVATVLPRPSLRFKRHAWTAFQKALDPLARPKPYPLGRRVEPGE